MKFKPSKHIQTAAFLCKDRYGLHLSQDAPAWNHWQNCWAFPPDCGHCVFEGILIDEMRYPDGLSNLDLVKVNDDGVVIGDPWHGSEGGSQCFCFYPDIREVLKKEAVDEEAEALWDRAEENPADVDRNGCVDGGIFLNDGSLFFFEHPDQTHMTIEMIARTLANICRFGGHTQRFYSVAEHSVRCVRMAEKLGIPRSHWGPILMHDAAEAFIGDMVRPLKVMYSMAEFRQLEQNILFVIADQFSLPFQRAEPYIKQVDTLMLWIEMVGVMYIDSETALTELIPGFVTPDPKDVDSLYVNEGNWADQFVQIAKILEIKNIYDAKPPGEES